jgi:hypothetical protein
MEDRITLTFSAKIKSSDCELKNSNVVASFKGRLSYAASSQLAISFLEQGINAKKKDLHMSGPYCAHQTVHKVLVLLGGCFFPRVPDFAVAALHQPSFEIDWVADIWVVCNGIRRKGQTFQGGVKVCYTILSE